MFLKKICIMLCSNTITDSKRQQTTTVDYKRLFNGFFLTNIVILHRENKSPQNNATMSKNTTFVLLINELREMVSRLASNKS